MEPETYYKIWRLPTVRPPSYCATEAAKEIEEGGKWWTLFRGMMVWPTKTVDSGETEEDNNKMSLSPGADNNQNNKKGDCRALTSREMKSPI